MIFNHQGMNILIASNELIPVTKYGGTERVIWYLGKELARMGHKVTYLVKKGSSCNFGEIIPLNPGENFATQIPETTDIVHFHFDPRQEIRKPHIVTLHSNHNDYRELNVNTVFVSKNHANRHGSEIFVYNGLDWDDYGKPDLHNHKEYFHFLGNAAWRVKNVTGAIEAIKQTKHETLKVIGGSRINFRMGVRITLSSRISFCGMVGGPEKSELLRSSKGLVFPVKWHEPFGLALVESLYFGCPVFGTPYGSLPEIITKEYGFLSSTATSLARAIENAGYYSKEKCHQYAADYFNSKRMAEDYLKLYEKAMNGIPLNEKPPALVEMQREKFLKWGK